MTHVIVGTAWVGLPVAAVYNLILQTEPSSPVIEATHTATSYSPLHVDPADAATLETATNEGTRQPDPIGEFWYPHTGQFLTYIEICAKTSSADALAFVYASDADSETE